MNTKNTQNKTRPKTLDKKIIENIYRFETGRTVLTILKYAFLIMMLTIGTYFIAVSLLSQLAAQKTLDLFEIFHEDLEVIRNYLPEVISTVLEELPQELTVFLIFFIVFSLVVLFYALRNFDKIKNRLDSILQHKKVN